MKRAALLLVLAACGDPFTSRVDVDGGPELVQSSRPPANDDDGAGDDAAAFGDVDVPGPDVIAGDGGRSPHDAGEVLVDAGARDTGGGVLPDASDAGEVLVDAGGGGRACSGPSECPACSLGSACCSSAHLCGCAIGAGLCR